VGGTQGATNVRRRILAAAVARANERLAKDEREPMPESLSPHGLRRTFASLLFAIRDNPRRVKARSGHRSPHRTPRRRAIGTPLAPERL
jgi:integrase